MRRLDKAGFMVFAMDPVILSGQGGPTDEATVKAAVDAVFDDRHSVALEHGGGCMLFLFIHGMQVGGGRYDMHFLFPEACRGERAKAAAKEMLNYMFTRRRPVAITGTISRSHRAARWFIRQLGFEQTSSDAESVHYSLDRTKWLGSKESQLSLTRA